MLIIEIVVHEGVALTGELYPTSTLQAVSVRLHLNHNPTGNASPGCEIGGFLAISDGVQTELTTDLSWTKT